MANVGYPSPMNTHRFGSLWASLDRDPALTDAVIAVVFAGFASLWLWLQWPPEHLPAIPAVAGLGLLQCLPLAWRRRYPSATLVVVTLGTILYGMAGGAETPWTANAWLLAAYSADVYSTARWRHWIRRVATTAFILYATYEIFVRLPQSNSVEPAGRLLLAQLFTLGGNAAFMVWIWWFGDATRLRREREAQLAERTAQLELEREANARRAVLDERLRIARELHDVVAHHVSLMGVQAGAARRVLGRRPEKAEEVLSAIEASSREAVREMHRLLGFLRQCQDPDQHLDRDGNPLAPQPGLRQLDALVGQMRAAGLPVALTVEGQERPLPPSVDLSAYRIVQEALTNTLKHAGPATATVTVRYGDRDLAIEIADDGGATPPVAGSTVGGNGLVGMRERVGLLGGRLQVGSRPGAGFAVRAELPLDGKPT